LEARLSPARLAQSENRGRSLLRVYLLTERYYPHLAGAERQLQTLVPFLAERGIEVVVVTRRWGGLARRAIVCGGRVYRLAVAPGRAAGSLSFTLGALLLLLRDRARIDIVQAYDLYSPATTGLLASLLLGRPLVLKVLGGGPLGAVAIMRRVRFGPSRLRLLARLVNRFIAVSDEIAGELRGAGVPARRVVRIPNGVDTSHFRPLEGAARDELRQALRLAGVRVAVYVGRLERPKGLGILLEAWQSVRRALPEAELLLLGDGPLRAEAEACAGLGVRTVGQVGDPLPYLQAADCFVLPSLSEGLSNALLEAMSTGLPCVATAVGGNLDLLGPGSGGELVAPGEPEALAAALVGALRGADGARGQAARARVLRDFSVERIADRLSQLYRELAESRWRFGNDRSPPARPGRPAS
jgi:glycosyltransferase involved in cell wall biosynthesis